MRTFRFLAATASALLLISMPANAAPNGNIIAAVHTSPAHKTLEAAIKAAKLTDNLANKGPLTLFAPTDAAFAKLPAGTVQTLLKPENRDQLVKILTYHVVPGNYPAAAILQAINAGGGSAELTTLEGSVLTAKLVDGKVLVTDESGRTATVITADLKQSNGVIHVTNEVFLPK